MRIRQEVEKTPSERARENFAVIYWIGALGVGAEQYKFILCCGTNTFRRAKQVAEYTVNAFISHPIAFVYRADDIPRFRDKHCIGQFVYTLRDLAHAKPVYVARPKK